MILRNERIILTEQATITQKTFRILLNAMSHPGRFYDLGFIKTNSHLNLVLETLLDCEVTFAVIGENRERISEEVRLLTGAVLSKVEDADFLIIMNGNSKGEIERARIGTPEYPDRGATLIYYIEKENSKPVKLNLSGPGIKGEIFVSINGLVQEEFIKLREINKNYPLGLDSIIIMNGGKVFCIPRSTRILEVF